jgi:amino acid transporter
VATNSVATTENVTQLKANAVGFGGLLGIGVASAATALSFAGTLMVIVAAGGHAVPMGFAIATGLMVLTGISFGEVNKLYPSAGGFYAFMRETTNPYLAWWGTWLYYLVIPIGGSTTGAVSVIYLNALTGIPFWILALAVCAFGFIVNWRGIALAMKTAIALWVVQVVGLLFVGILVFMWATSAQPEFSVNLTRFWLPVDGITWIGIFGAAFACVYAFCGFENSTTLGEETSGAHKKVYAAVVIAPIITGVVCIILGILWMSAVPMSMLPDLAASTDPLNVILTGAGMDNWILFTTIAVTVSSLGCIIGWWAAMTRIWYDKARAGSFPKAMGKLNKHQIPSVGMIVIAAITFICMILETQFGMWNTFVLLVSYGAVTTYALIHVASFWAYRNRWDFRGIVLNKLIPVFGVAVMAYVFIIQPGQSLISGTIWAVIGLIVMFGIYKAKGGKAFVMGDGTEKEASPTVDPFFPE